MKLSWLARSLKSKHPPKRNLNWSMVVDVKMVAGSFHDSFETEILWHSSFWQEASMSPSLESKKPTEYGGRNGVQLPKLDCRPHREAIYKCSGQQPQLKFWLTAITEWQTCEERYLQMIWASRCTVTPSKCPRHHAAETSHPHLPFEFLTYRIHEHKKMVIFHH